MAESPEDENLAASTVLRPKSRLRFVDLTVHRLNDGWCASVVLQLPSGEQVKGTADCDDAADELRTTANAVINALERVIGAEGVFDLLGIKSVKAFDTRVVIVAISAKLRDRVQRLVGSYLAGDDPAQAAAVAVLNATNRFMGSVFRG